MNGGGIVRLRMLELNSHGEWIFPLECCSDAEIRLAETHEGIFAGTSLRCAYLVTFTTALVPQMS